MVGGQVRVTPHHALTLPARQLLQGEEWGPSLHVPRRPGVPEVVPQAVTVESVTTSKGSEWISRTGESPRCFGLPGLDHGLAPSPR